MDWSSLGRCVVAAESTIVIAWLCLHGLRGLRKQSASALAVLVLLGVGTALDAQKTNGVNNLPPMPMPPRSAPIVATVTEDDVARGWRVECVTTNETLSYTMPSNAVYISNWHIHGARSSFGNNVVNLGTTGTTGILPVGDGVQSSDWSFPLGTNGAAFSSFWYFVDGRIRPTPKDAAHEICAVGVPMSAVPGKSRLWAMADGDCRVLTWENFFLGGDTNAPVNAQIRLSPNGDFTTSSNEVETVCRRVNPDDWDGDGIPNPDDANPMFCDGDFFGPANVLPEGANTSAYCTVSVVATGPDSLITFAGDGPSNYPDPCFIAKSGVTNEVVILIGKTYQVSSDFPVSFVGVSDPATDVSVHDPHDFTVVRPVAISFVEEHDPPLRQGDGGGSGAPAARRFTATVLPSLLLGEFLFESCCPIEGTGLSFSYIHDEFCNCRGCSARGRYEYEGFWLPASPPPCCCSAEGGGDGSGEPGTDDGPDAANPLFVNFSLPFALYEDPYQNEAGGVRVGTRARPVSLNAGVYGGGFGGSWTLSVENEGRLRQVSGTSARSGTVLAGEAMSLELEYAATSPSDVANDIVATLAFTENVTGSNAVATATLTAVKLELEAKKELSQTMKHRHCFGVAEDVICTTYPRAVSGLSFYARKGTYSTETGEWTCPVSTTLEFGGLLVCENDNPIYAFMTTTTPPTGIVAEHAVGVDFNVPPGTAGGVGMELDLYVLPKSVSFYKLSLAEVPTTTEDPTGYFTNVEFSAVWYHTTAMGAGTWKPAGATDTFWCKDMVTMGDAFPARNELEWDVGTIVWDIPVAWELSDETNKTYDKRIPIVYKQRFDFSAGGTLRVTKHGYWVERDADNHKNTSEGINSWIQFLQQNSGEE